MESYFKIMGKKRGGGFIWLTAKDSFRGMSTSPDRAYIYSSKDRMRVLTMINLRGDHLVAWHLVPCDASGTVDAETLVAIRCGR